MAYVTTFPGDIVVPGNVRIGGSVSPGLAKSSVLAQADLQPFPIPLTSFRQHDDLSALPIAGADDNLGLVSGTFGSATPSLRADDHKNEGSAQSNYARALVQLPWNYVDGQSVTIRVKAGMITTVASTTATLDCEAYKLQGDPDDAIGSDLCATAAQSINSLTFADFDFTITATALVAGDILDLRLTTAVNDTGTGTAVIAGITSVKLLCDVL